MSKIILFLIFNLFFYLCIMPFAYGNSTSNIYTKESDGLVNYYIKTEVSGCETIIKIKDNSSYIYITYGSNCEQSFKVMEDSSKIATSFYELIKHFRLESSIKSKKILSINIIKILSHAPLIKYLNESEEWPVNYIEYFSEKNSNKKAIYQTYTEHLRSIIQKSNIYQPFAISMNRLNCNITLRKRYVDGLFFKKQFLTKENLEKWGFFDYDEGKKQIFPDLKGGLEFDITIRE